MSHLRLQIPHSARKVLGRQHGSVSTYKCKILPRRGRGMSDDLAHIFTTLVHCSDPEKNFTLIPQSLKQRCIFQMVLNWLIRNNSICTVPTFGRHFLSRHD